MIGRVGSICMLAGLSKGAVPDDTFARARRRDEPEKRCDLRLNPNTPNQITHRNSNEPCCRERHGSPGQEAPNGTAWRRHRAAGRACPVAATDLVTHDKLP